MIAAKRTRDVVLTAIWGENPVFRQILGICSALAVTNLVLNTMVMGAAVIFTTALSGFTVSVMRKYTPRIIRMMVEVLIIAFYVILFDQALKAYWPDMSRNLGPYVGLIITNCIIMGRAEAFANANPPVLSFIDGLSSGVGYSLILICVAVVRELLGMGSLLGIPMPFLSSSMWDRWIIMVMPPGAFFTLAVIVWIARTIQKEKDQKSTEAKK
ncbi:MAG: NADH:ubiquinone reductase (Na(+)-transporting) subunit D [candidate division WOR-3 bacterium]|nr:NADH:ubiquinone reductase (Na(+)-transporting) subunit D [candidate division WOR-3 bacterium]